MKIVDDKHQDYGKFKLEEKNLSRNPLELCANWFLYAKEQNIPDYNAFALSTVSADGMPSSRMLLMKTIDDQGLVFYSNYESQKAKELEQNPNASILFFWQQFERQIRIQGKVVKITPAESYEYFKTRSITSQAGAWASKQSQPLSSRFKLMKEVAVILMKNPISLPLPPNWGGYRLIPSQFEFWQGRPSRLHDRFQYKLIEGEWKVCRLYP